MSNFTFILERLSSRAKNSLISAQLLSEEQRCAHIGTEHLLYGILAEKSSFAAEILDKSKLTPENISEAILKLNKDRVTPDWKPSLSENLKLAIEKAAVAASQFGYQFIGTEHFLYGLITTQNSSANRILSDMKVKTKDLEDQLLSMFAHISKFPDMADGDEESGFRPDAGKKNALEYFTVDLTAKARDGQLTPLIGRKAELSRLISILGRKTKNNPVLIGEAGVGKTAIAEGLAMAIVNKDVPEYLHDARVLSLDLGLLVAGSMFRGEFENRFKQLLEEIKQDKNVIVFIDEMHMLVNAGGGMGSMDAANLLKPSLARGEVRMIGATTLSEYRQFIEKDAALERRFQSIIVEEPTRDEAVEILRGIKASYEAHHKVRISDEAVTAAVDLSSRYINERHLPDKAVDILDETASILRMQTAPSRILSQKKTLENALRDLTKEKQKAVHTQDFVTALHLKDQEATLKKELEKISSEAEKEQSKSVADIDASHIARTVSNITKVPLQKLTKAATKQLIGLEKILSARVLGQDEAVEVVSKAIRRGRVGLSDPGRPIATFLFAGPSGVGKTELARQIAKEVFEDEKALIRVDMSEFGEKHAVSRLIGAPPGYVGFGEGGGLTESVRRKPYSVVLFDEIEKAHPDLANILLQILEDGRLTDGQGRTISFANTIVILTSNLGSPQGMLDAPKIGFAEADKDTSARKQLEKAYEKLKQDVGEAAKDFFRPELLNRIGNVLIFKPLGKEQVRQIAKLQLQELQNKLERQHIRFEFTPDVTKLISELSFEPAMGARKVRAVVREKVEDPIADFLITHGTLESTIIYAKIVNEEVVIEKLDQNKLKKLFPETVRRLIPNTNASK